MRQFLCSAILFDLDGVLVDSTGSVDRQWRLWAAEHNIDAEKVIEIAHGRRTLEVLQVLAPHLAGKAEVERIERREAEDLQGVAVMTGAGELLASIPAGRWCVVTSGTRHLATSRLRLGKLPIPDILVTAEDVVNGKPHPEPYRKGAEGLGVKAADCLVIEDAPAGISSAHAAGMQVIALPSTYPAEELRPADAVITSLREINVQVSAGKLIVEV